MYNSIIQNHRKGTRLICSLRGSRLTEVH